MHTNFTQAADGSRTCRPGLAGSFVGPTLLFVALLIPALPGCGAQPGPKGGTPPSEVFARAGTSTQPDQNPSNTAAVVQGKPIAWSSLRPGLAELAGAQVLEEAALDAALDDLLRARQLFVPESAVEGERLRVLETIASESGLSTAEADRALARIRAARGLGPVRFAQLLARNAKLRLLVSDEVTASPEELVRATELELGPRVTAILILVPDEKEAALVRQGMLDPPGPSAARLSAMARARSIDDSARGGGRVGPIHPQDPRVSAALRTTLASLPIGELSPVVAADGGFAIVWIESRSDAEVETPERRAQIEKGVRQRRERLAMERLARRLVDEAQVRTSDESLRWSREKSRPKP